MSFDFLCLFLAVVESARRERKVVKTSRSKNHRPDCENSAPDDTRAMKTKVCEPRREGLTPVTTACPVD